MSIGAQIPPPDALLSSVLVALFDLADEAGRRALANAAARRSGRRHPRGLTLRPGADTPRWNFIRERLRQHLAPRGMKSLLAREIGLPRQRLNEFLNTGSAMPDAERTLMILGWMLRREQQAAAAAAPRRSAPR